MVLEGFDSTWKVAGAGGDILGWGGKRQCWGVHGVGWRSSHEAG